MIVVALTGIGLAVAIFSLSNHSGAANASYIALQSALDRARTTAQTSGNGASVLGFPRASSGPSGEGTWLYVCPGRPNGNGMGPCRSMGLLARTIAVTPPGASAVTPPWAIYFNSDGSVAAASYPNTETDVIAGRYPAISSEPTCAAGSSVSIGFDYAAFGSVALPCAGGAMTHNGS